MKWDFFVNFSLHILNVCLFIFLYKRANSFLKYVGLYVLITFLTEIAAAYYMFKKIPNHFLYHFLVPVQYVLLALAYKKVILNKLFVKIIKYSIPLFILFAILIGCFVQKITEYNSIVCAGKNFLLSVWALLYLLDLFFYYNKFVLWKAPEIWITLGLLISSLGNFFIEGLMNTMIKLSHNTALYFYLIGVCITYFFYFTITIAFILFLKKDI
jgi:hypothetical protein